MNRLASYTWLKEYVTTSLGAEDFAREVSIRTMAVEGAEDYAAALQGVVVGRVLSTTQHPNADRLRVAQVDVGGHAPVEIVCGGANLAVDQLVPVALPGARVRWHGEGDLVTLELTEIRGLKSMGMICAPSEIGFAGVPCGPKDIWDLSNIVTAPPGTPLADALGVNDVVFDMEVTTNRPDAMGAEGLAREAAAALRAPFAERLIPAIQPGSESLTVTVAEPKRAPRYMAVKLKGLKNGPSPWWLQARLLLAGERPINLAADVTNYVRLELAQPLHVFDARGVQGNLQVRTAQNGETLVALDGKTYELSKKQLVIADNNGPLAIAGIMGGMESGVTLDTTDVIIEAATFEPVSLRRAARELNLQSASQLLYEKGLSTEALPRALARAVELLTTLGGAEVISTVVDIRTGDYTPQTYPVLPKAIRARLGIELPDDEMIDILNRLGFAVTKEGSKLTATVPYWRDHDLEAEVDLTEEIARIYGYHLMPRTLPTGSPPDRADDLDVQWESFTKKFCAHHGATELYSLSFVEARDLERYGLSPATAVAVANPLSADLSHLRPSLIPSLLRAVERNQAHADREFVFEVGRVYLSQPADLPQEELRLVAAIMGEKQAEQSYRQLRALAEDFAAGTGWRLIIEREENDPHYNPVRTARLLAYDNVGVPIGEVGRLGELNVVITKEFGVEVPVMVLELNLHLLLPHLHHTARYEAVSAFPTVRRDVAYLAQTKEEYASLASAALAASPLLRSVELVEIFRGAGIPEGKKSITLSYVFGATDHTLTAEEIQAALEVITGNLGQINVVPR
jgi:phenylalanyl-tRNA synthetase beta chain